MRFEGTPFDEAIDQVRDMVGVNILVNWKQLEQAGIDRKTPVQVRFRDVRFGKVLDEVLRQVSPDPTNRLTYAIDEGVITISTLAELSGNVVTHIYDVADLAAEGAGSDGDTEGGLDEIADTIVSTVEVSTWEDAGGVGTIRPLYPRGRLLITQTPVVHLRIETLLNMMRVQSVRFTVDLQLLQFDPAAIPDGVQRLLPGTASGEGKSIGEHEKAALVRAAGNAATALPTLSAISGQSARLRSGTDISYVGSSGASVVEEGRTITLRPSAPPEGGVITLAIKCRMAHLEKMELATVRLDPKSSQTATVQLPRVAVAEVTASVGVEDGQSAVVAVPELAAQGTAGRRTYLLLTPHRHGPAPTAKAQ